MTNGMLRKKQILKLHPYCKQIHPHFRLGFRIPICVLACTEPPCLEAEPLLHGASTCYGEASVTCLLGCRGCWGVFKLSPLCPNIIFIPLLQSINHFPSLHWCLNHLCSKHSDSLGWLDQKECRKVRDVQAPYFLSTMWSSNHLVCSLFLDFYSIQPVMRTWTPSTWLRPKSMIESQANVELKFNLSVSSVRAARVGFIKWMLRPHTESILGVIDIKMTSRTC